MINTLLFPLEWFVALVMVGFHKGLVGIGMAATSGWTWALSVVGLVVVLRILLIPLFVKQIRSARRMQLIQPELQAIQKKYKGKKDSESRQKMTEETMELYKRTGTNPFSSCLPILVQAPFFYALFRVLNNLDNIAAGEKGHKPIGLLTRGLAAQAEKSTLFGSKLSDSFLGTEALSTKVLTMVLIVLMSATMFITQHQLMRKNMPQAALDNPMAKQQKIIMYVMPLFFFITGPNFPIGVLIYWLTTNVWTMGQQFYTIRRMPAPGSAAERALEARRRSKGKSVSSQAVSLDKVAAEAAAEDAGDGSDKGQPRPARVSGQRSQPKKGQRRPQGSAPQQTGRGSTAATNTPAPAPATGGSSGTGTSLRPKTKRKR